MKKVFCVVLVAIMSLAMAVTASAASQAEDISVYTFKTEYTNDFSDTATVGTDFVRDHGTNQVVDGWLSLGVGEGGWVGAGPSATMVDAYSNYVAEFDIKVGTSDPGWCYSGFGFRAAQGSAGQRSGQLYGGGRNGVSGGTDLGWGITVDLITKNLENQIAVNYNYGAMGESTGFVVNYPEGFDPYVSNKITIRDFEDKITVLINNTELFTIVFAGLTDGFYTSAKAYSADGTEIASNENIQVVAEGPVAFYQRLALTYVDNITVKTVDGTIEVPPSETGDMSMVIVFMAAAMILSAIVISKKVKA